MRTRTIRESFYGTGEKGNMSNMQVFKLAYVSKDKMDKKSEEVK